MYLRLSIKSLISFLFTIIVIDCWAQEELRDSVSIEKLFGIELNELLKIKINVSSSQEENVFNTPSSVTVIDKEMFLRYHFQTVAEALSVVPGFDTYSTIIDKNVPTARGILQGFYANKVLLMINSIPTWQPIYGNGIIDRIDISDVKRIEVLKGPASVLYGSNAYAGVINIVLEEEKSKNISLTAFTRTGGKDVNVAGANIQINKGEFNIMLSAQSGSRHFESYLFESARGRLYNGDSVFQYTPTEDTQIFNFIGSYRGHRVSFNHFHFDHSYFGAHPSFVSGGDKAVENYGTMINYSFHKTIAEHTNVTFYTNFDHFERDFPLSQDRSNSVRLAGNRYDFDLKMEHRFSKYLWLEAGTKYEIRENLGHETYNGIADTLVSNNMYQNNSVHEWSAFAQTEIDLKSFKLLMGTRYTNNILFGDNFSSRATALFQINQKNTIKFIAGQSFRVPNLLELYFNHPTVIGNRFLTPELGTSYEFSYTTQIKNWYLNALIYHAKYQNLITRITPSVNEPSEYINADEFTGFGVETELKYQNPKLINLFVNYNKIWTNSDNGEQQNFRFVPDHSVSFGLNKSVKNWNFGMNGKWDSEIAGHLADIPPQLLLNLHIGYKHYLSGIKLLHR